WSFRVERDDQLQDFQHLSYQGSRYQILGAARSIELGVVLHRVLLIDIVGQNDP
ncbi:hypothetical protein Tco_0616932, partial [Tanacetum coccineum]